jgi:hypothetical protein
VLIVFLVDLRVESVSMVLVPGNTNEGIPFTWVPFVFPSVGHVGPPYIATLTLLGLTIGLPVWLFSTLVNVNDPSASFVNNPPLNHQPHVNPPPSSLVGSSSPYSSSPSEISTTSNHKDKKKKKQKIKKKKTKKEKNLPTTAGHVGSDQETSRHHAGSVDGVITSKNRNPKFPCRLCKGDHLLKD